MMMTMMMVMVMMMTIIIVIFLILRFMVIEDGGNGLSRERVFLYQPGLSWAWFGSIQGSDYKSQRQ